MSLSHGRPYLAIPGPSVVPDEVLRAMHMASPNIYRGALHDLTHSLLPDLKWVARTESEVAIYIGNGHTVWEAALLNTCAPGDRVLVPDTGQFCRGWAEMAAGLGLQVDLLPFGDEAPLDPAQVAETLRQDNTHAIKAVLAVHVDTATGVRNDIAALRRAIAETGHPALLMVDCIASLGCDRFEMDAWGVDVMVAACQKGLMTPAGVGFVYFNARADAARGQLPRVSHHQDWRPRVAPDGYWRLFNGTAPTHHLHGLRAALDMMRAEGIEEIWARHAKLAQAVWAALEAWSTQGPLRLNIANRHERSHAITSVVALPDAGLRIQNWTETNAGVTLGIGLGRTPEEGYFRIGHMGHVNAHMVLGVLGVIEAALLAEQISHGPGALSAAAQVISTA